MTMEAAAALCGHIVLRASGGVALSMAVGDELSTDKWAMSWNPSRCRRLPRPARRAQVPHATALMDQTTAGAARGQAVLGAMPTMAVPRPLCAEDGEPLNTTNHVCCNGRCPFYGP